jgi:putative two-component system response regulator
MMTGAGDEDRHIRALEAGADDYLKKPITMAKLRPRVQSAIRLKRYVDELDNAAASLMMLAATIEARDLHTQGHCERLADYGERLARRVGLGNEDLRAIDRGGFLHDLGKVAVPDAVLFKPGPLTSDEFAIIKMHPLVGERICMPLRTLAHVRPIIRQHHELLDGTGYPDGLRGSHIALTSQIVAFADVYDALTSDRPYRDALAPARALEMLDDACRVGQRDRALFDLFADEVTRTESKLIVTC